MIQPQATALVETGDRTRGKIGRREALRRIGLGGLTTITALGGGALLVDGFQRYGGSGAVSGGHLITHQLGWIKGVQFGGDFMALDRGYFADEGLDVRYTAGGPGTDYRTLVASGRTLVSESNPPGMIDGYLHGQPITAFAAIMQRDPAAFISAADRPITSLQDMVGKTIGLPNSMRAQVTTLLKRAGIDPQSVLFVPIGTDPSALVAKQVDAYYNWATTAVPALRSIGFDPFVLHLSDVGFPGYGGVLIARRDTLAEEHDLFVRYTRALIKGWRWMIDNPEETARIMVRKYAPPGADLKQQIVEAKMMKDYIDFGDALTKGLLWIDPAVFATNVRLAEEAGVIAAGTEIDLTKLVTQSVLTDAMARG
jgi:NitT/TauT family transport system substrate-binding protein